MSINEKAGQMAIDAFRKALYEDKNSRPAYVIDECVVKAIEAYESAKASEQPAGISKVERGTVEHLIKREIPRLLLSIAECVDDEGCEMLIEREHYRDIEFTLTDAMKQLDAFMVATKTPKREINTEKMREALQFIAEATAHNGKTGNEYRYPSQIRIHEVAKEALNYGQGVDK